MLVHLYVYVCMHCVFFSVYMYLSMCVCVWLCVCVCIHVCVCVWLCVYVVVCVCVCIHVFVYMCVCVWFYGLNSCFPSDSTIIPSSVFKWAFSLSLEFA